MIVRAKVRRFNRRKVSAAMPAAPTDAVVTLKAVTNDLQVTSDVPLVIQGIPQIGLSGGAHGGTEYPLSIVINSPTVFTLHYPAATAAANVAHMTSREPHARTYGGGYITPTPPAVT